MDRSFWIARWDAGQTGFHHPTVNPLLEAHHAAIAGRKRVLVPLCGKSLDMWWLRDQGHEVVGVELAEKAAREFFDERGVRPEVSPEGLFTAWRTDGVTILVGDVFDLVGKFDAVWDRAALVALPPALRARYASRLPQLVDGPGLLVAYDYPQEERDGPPFSVPDAEVRRHFPAAQCLEELDVTAVMNARSWGLSRIHERVYALDLSR